MLIAAQMPAGTRAAFEYDALTYFMDAIGRATSPQAAQFMNPKLLKLWDASLLSRGVEEKA